MNGFDRHGRLRVKGTQIVDENGVKYVLKGMSAYWLKPFERLLRPEGIRTLAREWKTNCLRLPVSTYHYCILGQHEEQDELLRRMVEDASAESMYVIIDWHVLGEQDPTVFTDKACEFFDTYSRLYAGRKNIIYEICNEPNGKGTWDRITEYADRVIPVIRSNDPEALIIVGTPTWSQDVDVASGSPLKFDNLAYSVHFYAATHGDPIREKVRIAHERGLCVFVSEFGLCSAAGNGDIDENEGALWKELIDEYGMSYICWNLSTVNEASAVLKNDCELISGWKEEHLKDQGLIVKKWFDIDAD